MSDNVYEAMETGLAQDYCKSCVYPLGSTICAAYQPVCGGGCGGYFRPGVEEFNQSQVDAHQSAWDTQVGGGHYKDMEIQPTEFCQRNKLRAIESNIIKYACRHRAKGGREDVKKIIHYAQLLLELEYPDDF